MKKAVLGCLSILIIILTSQTSLAEKICLIDNFGGGYWELKGGKVDKKTYTFKIIFNSGMGVCAGYADVTRNGLNSLVLGAFSSHGATGECNSVLWRALTDLNFNGSGEYDIFGDGIIEGTFSVTPVNCSILPPNLTDGSTDAKQKTKDSNHPALQKR